MSPLLSSHPAGYPERSGLCRRLCSRRDCGDGLPQVPTSPFCCLVSLLNSLFPGTTITRTAYVHGLARTLPCFPRSGTQKSSPSGRALTSFPGGRTRFGFVRRGSLLGFLGIGPPLGSLSGWFVSPWSQGSLRSFPGLLGCSFGEHPLSHAGSHDWTFGDFLATQVRAKMKLAQIGHFPMIVAGSADPLHQPIQVPEVDTSGGLKPPLDIWHELKRGEFFNVHPLIFGCMHVLGKL